MPGPFYFAWAGQGDAAMFREDEEIFAITLTHTEGNFPTLQIDVKNPRIGLLAAGRNVWAWLSYGPDPLASPIPVFNGRLIGVPENLTDEIVRLEFVARPPDYQAIKVDFASGLQVAPFWDPVWLQSKINDPDTALEARSQLWHIDRTTLLVTVSDIIEGEDGTVDVTADDHFYDAMTITYGQTPLRSVNVDGTVTWDQSGGGSVDLTQQLVTAFQNAGSPVPFPLVASMTGDGLLSSWPAPGTGIGGGWEMSPDSTVQLADWIKPAFLTKIWVDHDVFPVPGNLPAPGGIIPFGGQGAAWSFPVSWEFPGLATTGIALGFGTPGPLKIFAAAFPATALSVKFTVDFKASRKRSETVTFTLSADVQSIMTDPGADEVETISLSSDAILSPIDPDGATPLFDSRSSTYFKTVPRGTQSFEYLLMLARAKLLARARCVLIKFVTSWDFVIGWISCRYSVRLFDPRLPGGEAIGKITGYTLSYSTNGVSAEVTIGCTVGHGGAVAAAPGAPGYAAPGYLAQGYQALPGAMIGAIPGQVVYQSFDDFAIEDDDGVNLFNMNPEDVLAATPAVNLATTANATVGNPKLSGLADVTGLLAGDNYLISGPDIPAAATFTYDGGNSGTLSAVPLVTIIGTNVQITGEAHNGFTVFNGIADQANIVDAAAKQRNMPDPIAALKAAPTRVCVDLVSTDGGAFHVNFPVAVETMSVPQTINLEAS